MADTYGAIPIPVPAPIDGAEVTDPAVTIVAGFTMSVLNTYLQTAYSAVAPPVQGFQSGTGILAKPVVRKAFARDPGEEEFAESDLPAVYVFRNGTGGERPIWLAENYRVEADTWTLLWLFEPAPQATRTRLHSFVNGIVKVLDRAIESMRDPGYVTPWDPDPTARTTLPVSNAIVQPIASSLGPVIFTGPALNGTIGGAPFQPLQVPTVTVTGAPASGEVELVGIGSDGLARISRVELGGVGTFFGDFQLQQVSEVSVPAQGSTSSTLAFGLAGYVGRGTNVLVLGGLMKLEIASWRQFQWKLAMGDKSPTRTYPHALELKLNVEERWVRDINVGSVPAAVQIQYPTSGVYNDSVRETSFFT